MTRLLSGAAIFLSVIAVLNAQQQSPLPEMPSDVPKDATVFMFLTDGTPSGQDATWHSPDGAIHEFFQFNDRGRGPKIYITYRLDSNGLIVSEESKGVDYMKNAVEEHFSITAGQATWKNQAEDEKMPGATGKFYIDLNGGSESGAILARALLRSPNGKLPVLPSGEASIRKLQSVPVEAGGKTETATLYEIDGLSFTPNYLWLDSHQQLFASAGGGWSGVVLRGFEPVLPKLSESQEKIENAHASELAKALTHKPSGDIIIRNASLFDSQTKTVLANQRVTVHGDRIASVEPDPGTPAPDGATVIDASGKMLIPGLWDMHAHLYEENAFLDVATGVTTVRDLGNPIEHLTKLRHDIDAGTQIGPRVVPAGLIDGPGPFQGPIHVLAATPEEAIKCVDRYADLGYVQIKIYSSVKPELVPIIAQEAHKRGLRVSGHVPSGMIAQQFVLDGADEIQHMNFIFLNFMPDVKETRTPARFIEPGKRGASLDLNSQQVNDFIALLKQHHTVIDPTMGIWESTYESRPGQVPKLDAAMFDRLPPQVQRSIKAGGDALPASDAATDRLYRASYENMVRMVKKLYDSGIQLVAGTDAQSGYAFDRELEIYVGAGIPAPEVLRMATLEAATVMHRDKDSGSIAPGKFADMILVSGDPTKNISDIRHVGLVIKAGEMYRPSEMYPAFGIRPE
ncbi:MAG TPA: amidohydrolase family protein [Candidatus Limnocylindrales bacterium]|nr:amidohydrolase family protein [Candidatus Limnocylindrales bacterium]